MSGYSRATSARAAAIVLEDFCRGLKIPCCIYGHTSGQSSNRSVDLYNYVSFDNVDGKDKYRLMDISARCGNRDGAALKFVGDKLIKRPEECKILIIISDGQPADTNYYGMEAEEDVRNVKKQLNRAGVAVFAAAIGADKANIHRIYGDGFMDITDLNALPKVLCKLVTRFLK
jgi:nitric oxide reductase activation protein